MAPQLTFQVISADRLPLAQKAAIISLCSVAYEEDFNHLFENLPGSVHVLANLNGKVVSHAAWVTRWLQPEGGRVLRTSYVEAVATAPSHQRRGFATAVLRKLQTHLSQYELGGLSPSDAAFYERLGWECWRGPLAIRTKEELLPTPEEEVMILRLPRTPPLNLDGLLTAEWRVGDWW